MPHPLPPTVGLTIAPLASHRGTLPELRRWFEAEWPGYYGPGGRGDAAADLHAYAAAQGLPFGIVALQDGRVPCGVAVLKASSIASHAHLSPWAAAGLVHPAFRRQGIGARLLRGLEQQARAQGFARIHCATASAGSLLQREGWRLCERVDHEGELLDLFDKAL